MGVETAIIAGIALSQAAYSEKRAGEKSKRAEERVEKEERSLMGGEAERARLARSAAQRSRLRAQGGFGTSDTFGGGSAFGGSGKGSKKLLGD